MSVSSSSWGLGRAAVCDCGTPWTFLLPFLQSPLFPLFQVVIGQMNSKYSVNFVFFFSDNTSSIYLKVKLNCCARCFLPALRRLCTNSASYEYKNKSASNFISFWIENCLSRRWGGGGGGRGRRGVRGLLTGVCVCVWGGGVERPGRLQPCKLQCCIWRDSIKPSLRYVLGF